ncbi:MAG: acetyl-CoA decarbonylase/synthase complex subunit gamma [Chloroflexota bacterium]|nr:acetyl-CoA decarbonylase/synthase complex subunit gamma [Chloroflexota bacterium]
MPAKGTDIVKKLPESGKKNCKECGFPTCFAFAMKLASGGATLDKCPHLSPEVVAELEDALAPPQKTVTIGTGDLALQIGNEEVVYRHDKTFVNSPGFAILISDNDSDAIVDEKIKKLDDLQFDRVGLTLRADLLALQCDSGDKTKFAALAKKACDKSKFPVMLMSEDLDALFAARDACGDRRPLVYPITKENIDQAIPLIKNSPTPVGVRAGSVEELVPLTTKLKAEGIDELVLDPGSKTTPDMIKDQTLIRRSALKQNFRSLGYPTMAFPCKMAKGKVEEAMVAATAVVKYPAIIVMSDLDESTLMPLLVQRLNIYTDPRLPMSVEAKLYEILEPNENSPVLITSNWALTYFIVASEIESSRIPSYLLVKDTDGLGVLTGWAAGKFNGDNVGPFIKKSGVEDKTKCRKIIIPGLTARIKGELEENLPGWEVVIGPKEASAIPGYLPEFFKSLKN